jgi:DNA invertase Pin-like site-specific DNA recombinase
MRPSQRRTAAPARKELSHLPGPVLIREAADPSLAAAVAAECRQIKIGFSYVRFSDPKSKQTSIEDQQRVCDELAERHGAYIPPENRFGDEAIQGSVRREDRPGWNALCKLIEAGAVNILFADEHTRLFRSARESVEIKEQILKHNMTVICRDIDTTGDWELMWEIKAALGVDELRKISGRIKRAQRGLIALGKAPCGPPYGYIRKPVYDTKGNRDHTLWVPDPLTSVVVRRLYAERKSGTSYGLMANRLIMDGIPCPSGNLVWRQGTILGMLKRPIYSGILKFGPHVSLQPHLALVSTEDWQVVQPKSRAISSTGRGGGKYWAAGLVRCSCGATMTVRANLGRCAPALHCGRCGHLKNVRLKQDATKSVGVPLLEATLRLGMQLILTPERVAEYRESIAQASERTIDGELDVLNAKIATIDRGLKRMVATILAVDDDSAVKPFEDQACMLRDERSTLALAILRVKGGAGDITKADLAKQLKIDPRTIVPTMFDGRLPAAELRSFLSRMFPCVMLENRERGVARFLVTISPGALFSTSTSTPTIEMPQQTYRFRAVAGWRGSPPLVELMEQVEMPSFSDLPDYRTKAARATLGKASGYRRLAQVAAS